MCTFCSVFMFTTSHYSHVSSPTHSKYPHFYFTPYTYFLNIDSTCEKTRKGLFFESGFFSLNVISSFTQFTANAIISFSLIFNDIHTHTTISLFYSCVCGVWGGWYACTTGHVWRRFEDNFEESVLLSGI